MTVAVSYYFIFTIFARTVYPCRPIPGNSAMEVLPPGVWEDGGDKQFSL